MAATSPITSIINFHLAASSVQRMGSVWDIAPRSPMTSDAELEAEAERERDGGHRESDAILMREAQQGRLVEDHVLSMMKITRSLPPPLSRSQTRPNSPSPSNLQKECGATNWRSAAKSRRTPTKDPPTPPQRIILDSKVGDNDNKEDAKGRRRGRRRGKWPAKAQGKFADPAFVNLNLPTTPVPVPSSSPSSPTLLVRVSNMPPNLTLFPMRTTDTLSSSPSRETPPLNALFTSQGTLDVPCTLLMIAKRFKKLEKLTMAHVRTLEDRMNDVQRWLVDKEAEKEKEKVKVKESESESLRHASSTDNVKEEIHDLRNEVVKLQGRLGEPGREGENCNGA